MRADLENLAAVWRDSPVSAMRANEVLLVTDFDGTMADIGPDPLQTVALPGALDALRRLSHLLKQVVVLSSRTGADLSRLVPLGGVRLIGDSGLDPLTPAEKRALERFNVEAATLMGSIPGAWIEIKPASTTIHLRNAQVTGEEAMALLRPLIKSEALFGAKGRRVIEVHSRLGGKGTAMSALLDEFEPGGVVSMGDDENDRAAFEVLSARSLPHVCIGVSSPEVPRDVFARCDFVVPSPHDATAFLQMLADWASNSPPGGEAS